MTDLAHLLIRSGAAKPPSGIRSWSGWPDHVRDTLLQWNRTGRLSFRYISARFPTCAFCGHAFQRQATVAVVYQKRDRKKHRVQNGRICCDDCLIERAERASAAS